MSNPMDLPAAVTRGQWEGLEQSYRDCENAWREQNAALAASAARIEALTEACKSAQRQIELDNHNSAWVILNRAVLDAAPLSDGEYRGPGSDWYRDNVGGGIEP